MLPIRFKTDYTLWESAYFSVCVDKGETERPSSLAEASCANTLRSLVRPKNAPAHRGILATRELILGRFKKSCDSTITVTDNVWGAVKVSTSKMASDFSC
eukprot:scaffold114336_cov76-Cyclotella_meneghiniana.AAC.1